MISKKTKTLLMNGAMTIAEKAYAPYSGYKVGAALLCKSKKYYLNCNVENASYSLSSCAERNVVFAAISAGEREFVALAVYVDSDRLFPPCGACRQVLAEFCDNLPIIYFNNAETVETDLEHLLPQRFKL